MFNDSPQDEEERILKEILREMETENEMGYRFDGEEEDNDVNQSFVQWTSSDDLTFIPAQRSVGKLKPGLYEIRFSQTVGIYLERIDMKLDGLVKFTDSNSDKVIDEIEAFWESEELFKKFNQPYKRGIMLHGPPGSGKTCTIKLAIASLVQKRKGIVVKFTNPEIFSSALRIIRVIQPDTPIIVLMEDIDSIIEHYVESDVINLLDGVDLVNKVCFLATTNYPEKLGPRILNRPSRFDKRFYIGMPSADNRKIFLKHVSKGVKIDINKWVKDTEGFSVSHLKELFVQVVILKGKYEEALETLKSMKKNITSEHDGAKMGLTEKDEDEE